MRRMLVLLGVVIVAVLALFLLGRGSGEPPGADTPAARDHADGEPKLPREDAADKEAERPARETAAGRSVHDASSSKRSTEEVPNSVSDGERQGRKGDQGPTLAGAGGAGGSRSAGKEVPADEPKEGPIVRVRVVREGAAEPLAGALVVVVDASGQRHERTADARGVATFVDLPPGEAEADAVVHGWVSRWLLPMKVPASGKFHGDLRMQAAAAVHGFVRTARDRTPVSGARVVAIAGGSVHEDRGRSNSSRGVYETVETDATGRFRFRSLPEDEVCTLAVLAGGYRYADLGVVPRADAKEPVEILLERGGRLLGRVTDPEGRPVVGAEVFAFLEGQPHLAEHPRQGRLGREPERVSLPAVSGDDGGFEVVGLTLYERYAATAFARDWVRAEIVSGIVVTETALEATIHLRMRPAARVRIRLVDPEGEPVVSGHVVGFQRGRFSRTVAVGAEGTALIEGAPPGRLLIVARCEGFLPVKSDVEVDPGEAVELELTLEPLPPGVEVSGVAIDKGGTPIPDLTIVGTSLGTRQTVRTTTARDGRFVFSGLQAGKTTIRANQHGFEPSTLQIEAPAQDVRLVVSRFTRIRGRLKLAPGVSKPDLVYVSIERLEGGLGGGGSAVPFEDGTFEAYVKPDVGLRLYVCADTFAPWTGTVRVPEGETLDVGTIPVEAGISVSGVVLDPDGQPAAGVAVEVELSFIVRRTATTKADGRFRLEHLPVGRLSVKILAKGYAEQTQHVEAPRSLQDVRLVLTRGE